MPLLIIAAFVTACSILCICAAAVLIAHIAVRDTPPSERASILTSVACLIRAIRGRK
jgi:hypothetical protein